MGKYASEVIRQAQAWLGKKESNGSHKAIIDLYNSHKPLARNYKVKYTDEWCATFVSSVSIALGYTDIIPTECGCERMIELFKEKGCWVENENRTPTPGDIIFYDWQDNGVGDCKGWSDHVGIVEKVVGNIITVIEGNWNNAVSRRNIKVNDKQIRGYGVPKYDTPKEDLYFPKYKGTSKYLDVVLKAIGVPAKWRGTWAARKPLAEANGIKDGYRGTATQNLKLIALAKKGELKRP